MQHLRDPHLLAVSRASGRGGIRALRSEWEGEPREAGEFCGGGVLGARGVRGEQLARWEGELTALVSCVSRVPWRAGADVREIIIFMLPGIMPFELELALSLMAKGTMLCVTYHLVHFANVLDLGTVVKEGEVAHTSLLAGRSLALTVAVCSSRSQQRHRKRKGRTRRRGASVHPHCRDMPPTQTLLAFGTV